MVFNANFGTPVSPRYLARYFHHDPIKHDLPKIGFYDLRRIAAILNLTKSIPKVVQKKLCYSSITVTLDIYFHVLPDIQDIAARQIEELVTGAAPRVIYALIGYLALDIWVV